MSKICPKCKRKQEDPSYLGCENCRVPFIDATELVTNFSNDELKTIASFLLKDWRVYLLASIGVLIGCGLLYWQFHKQIANQINALQVVQSNRVAGAFSRASSDLAVKFQELSAKADNEIGVAYSSVTNQIAEQFKTPRIRCHRSNQTDPP